MDSDVIILGGGLVGATLGIGLAAHGMSSIIVDPADPAVILAPGFDGRASAVAPLGYLRLIMMAGIGWTIYGEVPTWATLVGGFLVIGSATYTIMRNALRASPLPPASPIPQG